jgi:hypothetical protein
MLLFFLQKPNKTYVYKLITIILIYIYIYTYFKIIVVLDSTICDSRSEAMRTLQFNDCVTDNAKDIANPAIPIYSKQILHKTHIIQMFNTDIYIYTYIYMLVYVYMLLVYILYV